MSYYTKKLQIIVIDMLESNNDYTYNDISRTTGLSIATIMKIRENYAQNNQ